MTRALRTLALTTALAATAFSAPALAADRHGEHAHTPSEAHATLIDRARNEIGQVRFQQGPTGVLITIEMDGLPESAVGWHGVHLHEIGDCSNEDFTSSGGHINPSGRSHGLLNPDGPDNADLPNIYVHENGALRAQLFTTQVSLNGETDAPALLDDNGSALVMHENQDDHMSQPIGGAGARHVCGVIEAAH
jgi:Cu-Zn family superoxide dismutase